MQTRIEYENILYELGATCIAGCDEAGRGPMAGPLTVACVIFEKGYYDERINDSKKLTAKKREELYDLVVENAKAFCIRIFDSEEVDQLNVYEASRLGMIECVQSIGLDVDCVLTDAMPLRCELNDLPLIKGDAKSMSIAAASILAKVYRDRLMDEYDQLYPEYGFKKHKGYVTKAHKEALNKFGPCPIHRYSFTPVKACKQKQLSLFEES